MNIVKERSHPYFLGTPADSLYSSTTLTITSGLKASINEDWMLSKYNTYMAKRATTAAGPMGYIGWERINGTSGHRNRFNPVFHTRHRGMNIPFGALFKGSIPSANWAHRCFYRLGSPVLVDATTLLRVPKDIDAMRSRAWANMQPEFGSGFSTLNFLFELKDFKDIAHTFYHLRGHFGKLFDALQGYYPRIKYGKIKSFDPTLSVSGATLAYNLMLAPLLRDFANIHDAFQQSVKEAQEAFQKLGLSDQSSHYREVEVFEDTRTQPSSGDYFWLRNGVYYRTEFNATLQYKYDYKMRNSFDAFCKYWGLSGSYEAMWNMMPFSFLVDYVVKIGKAIRAAERDMNVHVNPVWYGESIKTIHARGSFFANHDRFPFLVYNGNVLTSADNFNDKQICGSTGLAYWRYPSTPFKGVVFPKFARGLTNTQLANVLSLSRLAFK